MCRERRDAAKRSLRAKEMIGCPAGLRDLLRYAHATAIVGDLLKIRGRDVGLGDMALVEMPDGAQSLAQAIQLDGDEVSLQVFGDANRRNA